MTGYPGSVASAWQQAVGRRQGEALIVMVANSDPIDQYIVRHPDYFFKRSPESARINPDNLIILVDHLKCAAYELPFRADETFGENDARDILEYLEEEGCFTKTANAITGRANLFPPPTSVSVRRHRKTWSSLTGQRRLM